MAAKFGMVRFAETLTSSLFETSVILNGHTPNIHTANGLQPNIISYPKCPGGLNV